MSYPEKGFFAPPYYPAFRCIADRCRHSCCIDWEICIDDMTLAKYEKIDGIMATVRDGEDGPSFALTASGRCPHLNDGGLCDIIIAHGEDHLSDICRHHPRFYNDVADGRTEAGLGLVCEEACRLVLTDERPFFLVKMEEAAPHSADASPRGFDPLPLRDDIIAAIETTAAPLADILAALRTAYELPDIGTPAAWLHRFLALEILDPAWEDTLRAAKKAAPIPASSREAPVAFDVYYARLLTYFVYRHVSVAAHRDDLRARLAFAVLSADMVKYLFETEGVLTLEALADLARRYSAEIEYSEDNTDELIFALACRM